MPNPNPAEDEPGPVEQELIEATGVKPKPKEKRQAFLKRLNAAVNNEYEKDPEHVAWENLSQDAQQWINDGNEATTDGEDISDFGENEPDGDAEEAEDTTQQEESETTMAATAAKKKPAAAKAKAPAADPKPAAAKKAAAPAKPNGEKKPGKFDTIIHTAIKHPKKTGEELADMLPDFSRASVVTVRSDLRRTTKVLTDLGLLKENPFS